MRFHRVLGNAAFLVTSVASAGAQTPRPIPRLPGRDVDDPGVVATGQRITPAGLQMVVPGRVGGVRFGTGNELWVAAAGAAYRLDWNAGRVIARVGFRGRPGVGAVTLDPKDGRAFFTTIGPITSDSTAPPLLQGAPPRASLARNERAGLLVVGASVEGDSAQADRRIALPGDYLAGSPAIARDTGSDGRRMAIVLLPANDAALVVDADSGSLIRWIHLGVLPISAAISHDGRIAWIANFGGGQPTANERAVLQCCLRRAERVRVDARGVAGRGSVVRVDLATGRVTATIAVGRHANGLAWDESHERLYVTSGVDDGVTVVDTRAASVLTTIRVLPFRERTAGVAPTAVALSPAGDRLYITLGDANAVAMYAITPDSTRASLLGLIPTAWYPSSIDVSPDGGRIAVGTLFGVGSGEGSAGGALRARYVFAQRGTVHVVDVPDSTQLAAYTAAVAANNRVTIDASTALASALPRADAPSRPVPERPGEPSPIENVVFIVRENRTYDQVFGDLERGAHDSSLVMYGRSVTPNAHALAEQYVTLDHFFASGGNSADGHQWLTQARETEYPMWPLYSGRTYPSEGNDPLAYSPGGFLWETAQAKGKRVAVFGEYAPSASDSIARVRSDLMARWSADSGKGPAVFRDLLRQRYRTRSAIPSLDRVLVREYPGWTQEVPDVIKADVILAHLADWERAGRMPHLVMIVLPNDHTVGTSPGWCVPKACVADNDFALGRIVAGLSASSFWKKMAILVVEDDAQNGVDHIDGHRTVALAVSPYARRGVVDSTVYTQASMVKTIELMLGLPAMSLFDLVATDMRASFIGPGETPDFTPYTPLLPTQSLDEKNPAPATIQGAFAKERRAAAIASSRMRFDEPDAAPSAALNRILWHDARGYDAKYPGVHTALFFPLSVDLDDEDRELRRPPPVKRKR